ncbi:hypothetical protein HYU92_03440 [Candidatus Curtissbacteria bacterium]|nr:hypothetical protein [Candidatus Curtissbacteria bacterium]
MSQIEGENRPSILERLIQKAPDRNVVFTAFDELREPEEFYSFLANTPNGY